MEPTAFMRVEQSGSSYIIFLVKSFKIGDYIETNDGERIVTDMPLFNTTIKTFNESTIIIPNSLLTTQTLTNHSREGIRRVNVKFKVQYKEDVYFIKKILSDMIASDDSVVKNKDFIASVDELKGDGIIFAVIVWVKTEDYWNMYYSLTDNIEDVLRKYNIDMTIPVKYIK